MVVLPVERVLTLESCDAVAVTSPDCSAIFFADRLSAALRGLLRPHLARAIDHHRPEATAVCVPRGGAARMAATQLGCLPGCRNHCEAVIPLRMPGQMMS